MAIARCDPSPSRTAPCPVTAQPAAQRFSIEPPEAALGLYASDKCEIDLARRELRIQGSIVPIGDRAFAIMEILAQAAGQLVTKDDLIDRIWPNATATENTLRVHTAALRKALGKYHTLIRTESGRGYRLLGHWTVHASVRPAVQDARSLSSDIAGLSPTNLPVASVPLLGRAAVLQRLKGLVSAYRVVTLTGPGGIGKSALALKAGACLRADFPDGIWLVELAALSEPGLVAAAVAHAIGLRLGAERISEQTVARAIGNQKLLLILDNCEHVIEAAAALAATLTRLCPSANVLATSRESLRIGGEYVCRTPPLDVPPLGPQDVRHLLGAAAVAMFVSRALSLGVDFTARATDLEVIATVCRRLDGMPLAIEFAAAAACVLGLQQVADGLGDRFALLTRGRRTAMARHRTLRAALDWSYDLLPPPEQILLRRMAVFPSAFTLDALVAVSRDSGLDRSRVADGVASLVAKSLVTIDESKPPTRWRLLETIRAYALEKLSQHSETMRAVRQHAVYFCNFCILEGDAAEPGDDDLARWGRELDNVRAALDWCFSDHGDAAIGIDLTAAYAPVWMAFSLTAECCDRCEQALRNASPETTAAAALRRWLSFARGCSHAPSENSHRAR